MSRHRIVRTMDYNEEYDDYDDVYGHSVDDDSCISPTDAQQWLYDRARGHQSMSSFIRDNRNIEEEEEGNESEEDNEAMKRRRDSEHFQLPILQDDVEQAKLNSCLDEVRSVVGDTVTERRIVNCAMRLNYDVAKVLDAILNEENVDESLSYNFDNKLNKKTTTLTTTTTTTNSSNLASTSTMLNKKITANTTTATTMPTVVKVTISQVKDTGGGGGGFDTPQSASTPSPAPSGRNTPIELELDNKSMSSSIMTFKVPKEQAQRNSAAIYAEERGKGKSHFHMVVIGHVDAGKSTLMGHLLYDTGNVPQRVMHKYEQESKKLGKQSFMFAWVLDETGEERARGITMDVGQSRIETASKVVTLLDAPGHKDFIPNMISGATQADVALLVVDATRGEFETGFELGGQTREHALLVRSLGVQQLGVVINKLDTVDWSQARFEEIVNKLRVFLKSAGFKDSDVTFTPCSGLTGENLVKAASEPALKQWYNGPYLLEVIDNFRIPERPVERPLRMCVTDIFKSMGLGHSIAGRIETGMLAVNDRVLIGAAREPAIIKNLSLDDASLPQMHAYAGDQVLVSLAGNVDISTVQVGHIIYDPLNLVPVTTRFQARILVFSVKVPITMGYPVILHHQSLIEPAVICKLTAQIHKSSGEVVKKRPRCLGNNSCALIELETTRPICIERYADFKELGRFMLRVAGVTIAAGMVTKIR